MNQQNTMAGKTAADLVQAIATKLYGEAGAGITDLIALNNLVNLQSTELAPGNPLLAVARRNIRQFLVKASFASEMDRFAAGQCLDVMEGAIEAPPAHALNLGRVRAALHAAEGLCVCCASVDGYSRNELHAFGVNMRSQFRDALALIDHRT